MKLSSIGAGIVSVVVPDKDGNLADVVLGYAEPASYFGDGPCSGKIPGRYANRVALGKFTLDGVEYTLPVNNGPNHLHGGPEGFQNKVWESREHEGGVEFMYYSEDGEQGYPGAVKTVARYEWTEENELRLTLTAESDAPTVINLTNHAYFNLAGCNSGDVLGHEIWFDADAFTPTTPDSIPTGEIRPVEGTPFDFRTAKAIGKDIKADYDQLVAAKGGYDHNLCLNSGDGAKIKVYEPESGRTMEVYTDQPGVQFYTGNFLDGTRKGKGGCPMIQHAGFCLETQTYPDAPNHPEFPQCTYKAGEEYKSKTVYKFGVK